MLISKTDYLDSTFCRKNLWLKKHKPELFDGVELSEFEKKIIEEGNVADEAARNLFDGGVLIEEKGIQAVNKTRALFADPPQVLFQGAFLWETFFVQCDVLVHNVELDGWELYEVKATNDVKRTVPHHHVNDLAFQVNVLEGEQVPVVKAGVIHLNKEYRQQGEVNYSELFIVEDLTDEVRQAQEEVATEMQLLRTYLDSSEEQGCDCLYRGRSAQCTTFAYSHPQVPEYSVHDINRIGASKRLLHGWIDRGVFAIDDIDNPGDLKGAKRAQYDAYMAGEPLIDRAGIAERLGELQYPLFFFDYEGYSSAIPRFEGFGAYEQVPFQYSLHIVHEDGSMEHREFLITDPSDNLTRPLVEQMRSDIGDTGSVIVWFKGYESQRNTKLAELHPDYAAFLESLNDRMFDLMEIFSKNLYVDAAFKGSASIKNVLPVLVPDLTYKALGIQKGDQAVERWEAMITGESAEEKESIRRDLLEYCKLDTLAMVRIWEFLKGL